LSLNSIKSLPISVTIIVKTVNVNDAFVVVALAVRHVQDTIAHTLLEWWLAVVSSIVTILVLQLSSFLTRISRFVDFRERYS